MVGVAGAEHAGEDTADGAEAYLFEDQPGPARRAVSTSAP
jgi:hypothetical protein